MSMLEIQHLSTDFETENGMVHAVRDVSLSVDKGEVLGIVGASGSGKSQTMFSVMGLLSGNGIVKDGSITIDGKEISPKAFSDRKEYEQVMDHIRGNDLAMIFQDPMTFLNPVLRIETQLMEPILNHMDISKEEAKKRAIELMRKVGIPSPEARIRQYPHQFSGGMRQRIIIAIALACDPKIVETGTVFEIFEHPQHPSTIGLLSCISNPNELEKKELHPIPGSPPDLLNIQENCPFADRCASAMKICKLHMPQETQISATHRCSCWLQHPKACKGGEVQ